MEILSLAQTFNHCQNIVDTSTSYDPVLGAFFNTSFMTGCRWIELYEFDRWTNLGGGIRQLQPAKGNAPRLIPEEWLAEGFIHTLDGPANYWEVCRYSTIRRYVARFGLYKNLMCGDKEISDHVFRHYFIKDLADQGMTAEEIGDLIGELEVLNVQGYINSDLYVP